MLILPFILVACATESEKVMNEVKNYKPQQIFEKGDYYYQDKNYPKAIDYFTALENLYPYGEYAKKGLFELAQAYYYSDQKDLALSSLDTYIKVYPASESVPNALYLKAIINYNPDRDFFDRTFKQGAADLDPKGLNEAMLNYQIIENKYPTSQYESIAVANIVIIRNELALSEIYHSAYYMGIKAYVAAVNRAMVIVTNYPDTDKKEEALAILVTAYTKLNQPGIANDYRNKLKSEFPGSIYLIKPWQYKESKWYSFRR